MFLTVTLVLPFKMGVGISQCVATCLCDYLQTQFSLTACPQFMGSGSLVGAFVGVCVGITLLYTVIVLVLITALIYWNMRHR